MFCFELFSLPSPDLILDIIAQCKEKQKAKIVSQVDEVNKKNSAVVFILQVLFPKKPTTVALKCRMLGQIQEVAQSLELACKITV